MPATLRMDQTLTGTITYKDHNGNPVPLPANLTVGLNPGSGITATIDQATGKITVHPENISSANPISINATGASTVLDSVTVAAAAPVVGTLVWDAPTPA